MAMCRRYEFSGWVGDDGDGDAQKLEGAFGIKTVRDLGTNKYFHLAQALVALGGHSD